MQIEELLEEQNANLTEASNQGDNSAMIEHAQAVGKSHQAIDELFERLEVASDKFDEIVAEYEVALEGLS